MNFGREGLLKTVAADRGIDKKGIDTCQVAAH
jgi:hypothetical protein